jgi:hypothetical protein
MPRNTAFNTFIGCLCFIITLLTSTLSAITIDDFSEGNVKLTDTLDYRDRAANLKTGLSRAHTLNTARYITFNAIAPAPYTGTGVATVSVENDSWKLAGDPGVTAANLYSIYGDTKFGLPPMSLNLAAYGATSLVFDFDYTIPDSTFTFTNNFYLDISLYANNGTASAYVYQPIPLSAHPFSVTVPLTKFLVNTPTFDLNHVTQVMIGTANGNMRGAFAISTIRTDSIAELLPGDFNLDGRVDAADYITWRNASPQTYSAADYQTWRANFGHAISSGASLTLVPEPLSCTMLSIGALLHAQIRRRPQPGAALRDPPT